MVTWPIFVALFLSISAVFLSVQAEKKKANEIQDKTDKTEYKRLDLIERKKRIAKQNNNQENQ